jgi:DNA polymerase III subunit delta'
MLLSERPLHHDANGDILGQIIISEKVEEESQLVLQKLQAKRALCFYEDDYLIEHVKPIVKEAYIAESSLKYIILASQSYRVEVQNALLKLIEEPPKHIRFIIIAPSKSILLPTILSRMPLWRSKARKENELEIPFSFARFDLIQHYEFVKGKERLAKREAIAYVEMMLVQASKELPKLTEAQLKAFENAIALLHLNTKANIVFSHLLLLFLPKSML